MGGLSPSPVPAASPRAPSLYSQEMQSCNQVMHADRPDNGSNQSTSRCHALQFIACPQPILPVDVDARADLAWPPLPLESREDEVVSGDWITGLELPAVIGSSERKRN